MIAETVTATVVATVAATVAVISEATAARYFEAFDVVDHRQWCHSHSARSR